MLWLFVANPLLLDCDDTSAQCLAAVDVACSEELLKFWWWCSAVAANEVGFGPPEECCYLWLFPLVALLPEHPAAVPTPPTIRRLNGTIDWLILIGPRASYCPGVDEGNCYYYRAPLAC